MTLHHILLIAALCAGMGAILLIPVFLMPRFIKKKFDAYNQEIHDTKRAALKQKFDFARGIYRIIFILTVITFIGGLVCIGLYSYFKQKAKKYGAYGDFENVETISSIQKRTANGYVDQSNNLPDDLSGYIVIFFKYGCPDCENIHDKLMAYIDKNQIENIVFVSSRSENGEKLRQDYPIDAVPCGIYVRIHPTTTVNRYTEILYEMFPEEDQTDLFIEENMAKLVEHQKNQD